MKTIFTLYKNYGYAQAAVEELLNNRFNENYLNVIAQELTVKNSTDLQSNNHHSADRSKNAEKNQVKLDQLLVGKKAVPLADAGKVIAAGELAAMLAKFAASPEHATAVNGLQAALLDFGLAKEAAAKLSNGVKEGQLMLFLRTEDERASEAASILKNQEGLDILTHIG